MGISRSVQLALYRMEKRNEKKKTSSSNNMSAYTTDFGYYPPQQEYRRATYPVYDYPPYEMGPPSIKLEDGMLGPTTHYFQPPQRYGHGHGHHIPSPPSLHPPVPVQHTDDAASKETQYLRRRCFNCHTTEPPSWRRSTLNPGKIVCNKCGLYERTHLRPRPLRFDELRAGGKGGRKGSVGSVTGGKKTPTPGGVVKKEPREFAISRRTSVSSSDWDSDTVPPPPPQFNDPSSYIRLPNTPLSEIDLGHGEPVRLSLPPHYHHNDKSTTSPFTDSSYYPPSRHHMTEYHTHSPVPSSSSSSCHSPC